MIYTVTFNPALDYVVHVDALKLDAAGFGGHLDVKDEGERQEILKIERKMVVNEMKTSRGGCWSCGGR